MKPHENERYFPQLYCEKSVVMLKVFDLHLTSSLLWFCRAAPCAAMEVAVAKGSTEEQGRKPRGTRETQEAWGTNAE